MLLAGDVGASKTVLALIDPAGGPRQPLAQAIFPSERYADLDSLVAEFLALHPVPVEQASFGLAGVVSGQQAEITNLAWPPVDARRLAARFGFRSVSLLNDLEALAYAVPRLVPADLHSLHLGLASPGGAIAVIAPGTGLGEAFLLWDGSRYRPYPSEGGNVDFAPTDELQIELLRYLRPRYAQVSYEQVCSGLGLPNLYSFLRASGRADEPAWLAEQFQAARDPTPLIVQAALDGARPCALALTTLRLFVAILGAEAGNLALKVLATGGLYLGGGIPPRIVPLLEEPGFLHALRRKGPFQALLEQIPVHVIRNPRAALLGAAYAGMPDDQQGAS
jgi:glucokinase